MHENCERCKLYQGCKTPFMKSSGSDDPLVLVVGEAPGATEDDKGVPFVGQSGQLLRELLEDSGFDVDQDVRFTNVVRCRPPDNKISKRAINYCKHFALDDIEHYDPKLVLLMGNSPLNAVLGQSSITNWNGVVIERDDRTYVPLFHPAYIMRNQAVMGEWIDGMEEAAKALVTDSKDDSFEKVYPLTIEEVYEMEDYLAQYEVISYDDETGHLDPFNEINKLVCASFAAGDKTFAVPVAHDDALWDKDEEELVADAFHRILNRDGAKIVGHNIKFDQLHTRKELGIEFTSYGDTMLLSHMIDSRKGIHGLKRLAGLHLGMYDYDEPLEFYKRAHHECDPNRGGSYANFPLDVLLPYAALDTEATLKLFFLLYEKLSKKQRQFYHDVLMPASNALAEMEYNGNAIDMYIAERYATIYDHVQREMLDKILQRESVQRTIEWLQQEADQKLVDSLPDDTTSYEIMDTHVVYEKPKKGGVYNGKRKRAIIEFNPNSTAHLRQLYFEELGVPVDAVTDTGLPSTSADNMKAHVEEYPVVELIMHYKLLTKMLGTYIMPAYTGEWLSGDGRVRSTYNLHGTLTGRLSSSNPNMQNIPTPEKEADTRPHSLVVKLPIKNLFTHTFEGGVLMSVDYSGMELRVFASLADCQPMLEIHKSGADFHSMVSIMAQTGRQVRDISVEETKAYKKEFPEVRYRYKWTNWTLLYGGDEFTLMNLYGMSEHEAKSTVSSYYETFPEVLDFRKYCVHFAEDNGYIESPFGRREYLHYINEKFDKGKRNKDRRSAVNMPVQSSASDILLCALIVIKDKIKSEGMRTMLVNTVHDSIVLDVPLDEIEAVAALCVDVMENITTYGLTYFPNVSFKWLKSPLKADVEVGTHYGTEISFSEWMANGKRF